MKQALVAVAVLLSAGVGPPRSQGPAPAKGVALADLAWPDAEAWLTATTVVVIPLGAGALEQGRHLRLNSDERLARHLAARVQADSAVVVAPALNYHAYSAYAEYPGSTPLSEGVARDVTVDAVRSLARPGPRRFYVLNTSAATIGALQAAARTLADAGILLGYTDPDYWTKKTGALKQTNILVAHADEAATSMMLFVDPAAVDMTRASREYPSGRGVLTRQEGGIGVVSKSGVLGDATLATAAKGKTLVDGLVAGILEDIENVRRAPLPAAKTAPVPPPSAPAGPPRPAPRTEPAMPNGCLPGDDRAIRNIGNAFSFHWSQQDAQSLAGLFTKMGDIRHPDGSIERGREVILANRSQLFTRREYQNSKHPLQLTDVRCVDAEVALADGKWELRLQDEPQSTPGRGLGNAKSNAGWCTLVVVKGLGGWQIEAWRYTVDPPQGAPQPTLLSKPGYIGRGGGQPR
jgi:creatinine amidohydrolase